MVGELLWWPFSVENGRNFLKGLHNISSIVTHIALAYKRALNLRIFPKLELTQFFFVGRKRRKMERESQEIKAREEKNG